jgi:hypothetical protein
VNIRGVAVSKIASAGWPCALALASIAPPAAHAECAAPRLLLERFIPAECDACWRAIPPTPAPAQSGMPFVLDWIVPSASGAKTTMSHAAVADAAPRATRAGSLRSDEVLTQSTPLPERSALRVKIEDGPAWNGYVAMRLEASYRSSRALPQGLAGYLALVERIQVGDDGSPVARQVVRTVIGPLPLTGLAQGHSVDYLRAARVPDNVKAERIAAVGWLETPAGRVLSVASSRVDAQCK